MKRKKFYLFVCIVLIMLLVIMYCIIKSKYNPNIDKIEHIISIKTNNKKIDAVTSSFCYKNGTCIDKIDFQDFKYNVMSSYSKNKLYIDNLDGSINSIELFDYGIRKLTNIEVNFTNEYIITPSVSGVYIFIINAVYQDKTIEYYFMCNINKISGDETKINIELKDNSLTDKGLIMVVTNTSNPALQYGNPYTIEKYENRKELIIN